MADLKARLLPPRPPAQESHRQASIPVRPLFQGMDLSSLKKRGQEARSWIRIGKDGVSQVMEVDKLVIMRRCDLPVRDLRLLDPLFVYPSTILGREKAIIMNLEQIRCIITADEVLLLNSLDSYVLQYVAELQRRLAMKNVLLGQDSSGRSSLNAPTKSLSSETKVSYLTAFTAVTSEGSHHQNESYSSRGLHADYMPFEFLAMEVALEAACTFLDTQDNVRNQLIQFELILTVSTFVVAIFGVVAGVFGMNIPIDLFDEPKAFKWVLIVAGIVGSLIFSAFMWYFKRRGLMRL